MKAIERDKFINKSKETLKSILDIIEGFPSIKLSSFKSENTALIIMDMINGFVNEGPLKSDRVKELIPETLKLIKLCQGSKIPIIAFADSHSKNCPEFESYPEHCIMGTSESQLVKEINEIGDYILINKNSTNGILEKEFLKWLENNSNVTNFIIAGDCTDLCILQFSLALKAYFNKKNINSNTIVPVNVVETYDLGLHDGNLMNVFALYNMWVNGVKVVKEIEA
ncbi:MAG: nicotinamidase-like amidase [Clostridiales bacterium]|jgi:nicotinamidase-related amidase|nr:nicotinamidase-like amidase [Clostridiales bacterium]